MSCPISHVQIESEWTMKIFFTEEQRFTQWWLWLILLSVAIIPVWGIYKQIILGQSFGDKPMSDAGLIAFALFVFGIIFMFRQIKLITTITDAEISFRFTPFVIKTIRWDDVSTAQVVHYGFVGGWGIRLGTKYGTIYNVKGAEGLALQLHSGKKICIGTQKSRELEIMVDKVQKHKKRY